MNASTVRVVGSVVLLHLKQMAVDSFVLFTVIVQPLLVALLAIYMLRQAAGFEAIYVIVGSALTGLWSGTIYISSRGVELERWSGTLETILGSPTPLYLIIIGKALATVVLSLGSMLFSYPLAAWLFHYQLAIAEPGAFAVSAVLTVLALMSLGLVLAPVMSLNPGSWIWSNAIEFPVYIAGGFLFPIALLPGWLTPLSYALAPYWGARALHLTSSGGGTPAEVWVSWGMLLLNCVVDGFLAAWLFRVLVRRARAEATLGMQ